MGHTLSSIDVCAAAARAVGRHHRRPMVRQGQHAEPWAPRRVARDRRGCAGYAAIRKPADHRRLLTFPHRRAAVRDPGPPRSARRGDSNPRPPKCSGDGWLGRDFAGSVLPYARSVDTDSRPASDVLRCNPMAAAHPSRSVRPPRRRRPSGSLRARTRSRQARGARGSDAAGV